MDFSTAISPQITRALSNTFIYSLWQGLILAAAAGLIILLTQKSASRRRYNLLIASLTLFSAGVVVTFIYQLQQPATADMATATAQQILAPVQLDAVKFTPSASAPATNTSFIGYINTHASTIVLIWFLIVCARCLQLLTGLHGLHRLRHQSVSAVGQDWEKKLAALATRMGIKQMVTMAESGLAKVPMVIGHLKPIILIPAGLITAMPPAEIEAVLIHELAHIRRRDYLVNLLQHMVEIIFFFNPAVLWLSSLIKAERENCCDDITLTQTNSKAAYIRALISCQEYQLGTSRFAMALGKRKNLLGRVSRMVSSSNHSLSILEKSLLTVCLVMAGLAMAAFSGKEKKQETDVKPQKITTAIIQSVKQEHSTDFVCAPDTVNPGKLRIYQLNEVGNGTSLATTDVRYNVKYTTYLFKKEGVLYQCNFEEGKMNSLQVNGKTIPTDKWTVYKSAVDKLISEHDRESKESLTEITEPAEQAADLSGSDENGLIGLKKSVVELDKAKLALTDSIQQLKAKLIQENGIYTRMDAQPYKKAGTEYKAHDAYKTTDAYKAAAVNYQVMPVNPEVKVFNSNVQAFQPHNEYKGASDLSYPKAGTPTVRTGVQEYKPRDGKMEWITTEVLIAGMVKEGIVARPQDIKSFMLSNEQMILNGKKMPADIHQLMLDKYVRANTEKDWSIFYNFDTSTMKKTIRSVRNAD
jgi:bla regulator protein BlaR1